MRSSEAQTIKPTTDVPLLQAKYDSQGIIPALNVREKVIVNFYS